MTEAERKYDSYNISQSREFSWDDKGPGIMLLLAMITEKEKYVDDLQQYCDDVINKKPRSPGGMVFISKLLAISGVTSFIGLKSKKFDVVGIKYENDIVYYLF